VVLSFSLTGKTQVSQTLLRNPQAPDNTLSLAATPHQEAFAMTRADVTYLAGGWGSGKSIAGLAFCAISAAANPGCTGLVVLPTHKLMREFVNTMIRPAMRDMIVGESKQDSAIHLLGGGRIVYLSGHTIERLEMYNAAWAYVDEAGLLKRDVLPRAMARLRDNRARLVRLGLSGTPHWGWLKDEFDGQDSKERRIIHAKTMDNPHNEPTYYDRMLAQCPARMREAYLNGHFVAPGGGVYSEFDLEKHVTPYDYRTDCPVVAAIDWSPRTPHVLFLQLLPAGARVTPMGPPLELLQPGHQYAAAAVVDELVLDGAIMAVTTQKLGQEIRARGYPLMEFVCDPAGRSVEASSGRDQVRIMRELLGVYSRFRLDAPGRLIANGVDMVRCMLEPEVDHIPRLYISQEVAERAATLPDHLRARSVVNALPGYSYSPIKDGKAVDLDPVKDGVTDHAADCIRYVAANYFPVARLMERRLRSAA